jgi:hypothetical protein
MGKFVGLVGAMTTVGALAYLMAPLPQSANSIVDHLPNAPKIAAAPVVSPPTAPAIRTTAARTSSQGEPTVLLVQQIQSELHRLGCYGGAIDGQWNDATQRAMQTLGERVSVLRPVDTPDYIMLALARGQAGTVCASTQRSAAAEQRARVAAIATPELAGQGKGQVRPTSGTSRLATPGPDRPVASEPPKVWRAVPEAPPKRAAAGNTDPSVEAARLKAARDELNRIEMRKRAAIAASPSPQVTMDRAPQATISQAPAGSIGTPADPLTSSSRSGSDTTRMALGVGPVDPLQAHIDPRNPNAPAIMREPPQPLPRLAARNGDRPAVQEPARTTLPPPPANAATPSQSARAASKQAKRAWQRKVFTDMRFNGP